MSRDFWEGLLWGMGYRRALEKKKKCSFCGKPIPADSNYCPYCGRKL